MAAAILRLCVTIVQLIVVSSHGMFTKELTDSNYTEFLAGDDVKVVYFFKKELPQLGNFLKEMEKSAVIMDVYKAKFALVDCTKHKSLGYCNEIDSQEKVYMYRRGQLMLDTALNSMFDVDSIVSNVLQVIVLNEVPILQSLGELDKLESDSKGYSDVVISYQFALGTHAHRILLEVAYVHHEQFHFAISNEQSTVKHLLGYSSDDKAAVWILRCKNVVSPDQHCPVIKFGGQMKRNSLASFFRALQMPAVHYVGKDGLYNPYADSDLDSVYLFCDTVSETEVNKFAVDLSSTFYGFFGIVVVNLNEVDGIKLGYQRQWKVPSLALRRAGQTSLKNMPLREKPQDFLTAELNLHASDFHGSLVSMPEISDEQKILMCLGKVCSSFSTSDGSESGVDPEVEDDSVAEAAYNVRNVSLSQGHLHSLTGKTLTERISKDLLLVVLFYVHFEARSQLTSRVFAESAELLSAAGPQPLATVNCFDWPDVCERHNVSFYPTVRIYRKDQPMTLYRGLMSTASLTNAVRLFMTDAPIVLSPDSAVWDFLHGKNPNQVDNVNHVSVLGAFPSNGDLNVAVFDDVAKRLHGELLCAVVLDSLANSICETFGSLSPCIVVYKRDDVTSSHVVLTLAEFHVTADSLVDQIRQSSLPLLPELTILNFAQYIAKRIPFVIGFTSDKQSGLLQTIRQVMNNLKKKDVIFAWMNLSDQTASSILRQHVTEPCSEELLIIDHQQSSVFHFAGDQGRTDDVESWIWNVLDDKITTEKSLADTPWKPSHPGFDFLQIMDDDARERRLYAHTDDMMYYQMKSHTDDLMDEELHKKMKALSADTADHSSIDLSSVRAQAILPDISEEVEDELDAMVHSRLFRRSSTKKNSGIQINKDHGKVVSRSSSSSNEQNVKHSMGRKDDHSDHSEL